MYLILSLTIKIYIIVNIFDCMESDICIVKISIRLFYNFESTIFNLLKKVFFFIIRFTIFFS